MKVWPLDFPSLATKGHQKCFKEKWLFSLNFVLLLSTPFTLSRTQTVCLLSQSFFPILSLCFSHSSLPSHSHHLTFYLSAPINFSLMMFFTFLSSFSIPNLLTLSLSLSLIRVSFSLACTQILSLFPITHLVKFLSSRLGAHESRVAFLSIKYQRLLDQQKFGCRLSIRKRTLV